ncbi:MAG: hypothetical protein WBM32_00090 [Crocosphaera sp.]
MYNLIRYVYCLKKTNQGFTTIDILAGTLMISLFFSVSMQVLAIGTVYRIQGQKIQKANLLIQEDIERVRLIASQQITQNNLKCNALTYDEGYAKALADSLPVPSPHILFNKNYKIDRIYDPARSVVPHKLLKITYEFKEWNGTQFIGIPVTTYSVEVTPDVASFCY